MDSYITAAALRETLKLTGTTFANDDIEVVIPAASRAIDGICDRYFGEADLTNGDPEARYFSPDRASTLEIDDAVTVTEVAVDYWGLNDFDLVWVENTDYVLEPLNAPTIDWPYGRIRITRSLAHRLRGFPAGVPRSVRVTARWGWPAVPEAVVNATSILATRLLRRMREAPFGVITVGIDVGAAMRIARLDPDVIMLLDSYRREVLVV